LNVSLFAIVIFADWGNQRLDATIVLGEGAYAALQLLLKPASLQGVLAWSC
jgi:hypothetical protein